VLLPDLHTINGVGALNLTTVAIDDMVALAEAFIDCQDRFRTERRPVQVTVGYHYTKPQSMNNIRTDGLMSGPERRSRKVTNFQASGSVYGEGIYTANNPDAFQGYGTVGLLLAVLKGNQKHVSGAEAITPTINTVIGNKSMGTRGSNAPRFADEIVIRTSAQCIPLFSYGRSSNPRNETDILWQCHEQPNKNLHNERRAKGKAKKKKE